jgi:hypothetical protein
VRFLIFHCRECRYPGGTSLSLKTYVTHSLLVFRPTSNKIHALFSISGPLLRQFPTAGLGRDHLHLVRVERMEEIQWKARILFVVGGKPAVVVPRFENQCKAVVNGTDELIGLGSDDGKRFKVSCRRAASSSPTDQRRRTALLLDRQE